MADDAATGSTEEQITFNVKSANDQKHVVTVPSSMTVAALKEKLSSSDYADIPADRQRLIYSGRVLKDPDTLASFKIKDGHTVHLVKGAASNARQNPANQGSSSAAGAGAGAASQVPTNLATGTGNNPLAGLTGARYAGFHGLPGADMFGPDGGMGPPPDQSQLLEMMENPMFLSQMNEAMNNPAVIEMMTQSPMIRNNPMLADIIRNPEMRRMMFNPDMIRMQLQMQRSMGNSGAPSFPMPGQTDTTPQTGSTATGDGTTATPNQPNTTGNTETPQDPLTQMLLGRAGGAGGAGGANPFASLFGAPGANPFAQAQTQNTTPSNTGSAATGDAQNTPADAQPTNPANPFGNLFGAGAGAGTGAGGQGNPLADMTQRLMQNPEALQAAMNMMGQMGGSPSAAPGTGGAPGAGAGAQNPFAALFGPGGGFGGMGNFGSPAPPDNRPPEQIYESQLQQLNEMGFYEFDRNVQALRRSGGNVQGAIEYLLSGGS